jgi:hypothetical protein
MTIRAEADDRGKRRITVSIDEHHTTGPDKTIGDGRDEREKGANLAGSYERMSPMGKESLRQVRGPWVVNERQNPHISPSEVVRSTGGTVKERE